MTLEGRHSPASNYFDGIDSTKLTSTEHSTYNAGRYSANQGLQDDMRVTGTASVTETCNESHKNDRHVKKTACDGPRQNGPHVSDGLRLTDLLTEHV